MCARVDTDCQNKIKKHGISRMKGREWEDIADICLLNASDGENTEEKKRKIC